MQQCIQLLKMQVYCEGKLAAPQTKQEQKNLNVIMGVFVKLEH